MLNPFPMIISSNPRIYTGDFDIIRGARYNDFAEVNGALKTDPRCITNTDNGGRTAAHIVAHLGFFEMLKHLAEQPGIDLTIKDIYGRDVLKSAWESAKPEIAYYIADRVFPGMRQEFVLE